jgi:hypothetical protein
MYSANSVVKRWIQSMQIIIVANVITLLAWIVWESLLKDSHSMIESMANNYVNLANGWFLKHEGHQHFFFLALRSSYETCKGCVEKRLGFVCTNCNKFALCIGCATLSLVARYQYDIHLLKFSYAREDDSGEYYCLICEKEWNHLDYWFYYCVKCNFFCSSSIRSSGKSVH